MFCTTMPVVCVVYVVSVQTCVFSAGYCVLVCMENILAEIITDLTNDKLY